MKMIKPPNVNVLMRLRNISVVLIVQLVAEFAKKKTGYTRSNAMEREPL
jgi:hypothetical protein